MYELKTVDVWDTLLRRKCHPDSIKLATARYFYFKYYNLHHTYDIYKMLDARINIESKLGREKQKENLDDEYEINNVLEYWVREFLPENLISKEIINDLYRFEVEHEKRATYPDPSIEELLAEYPAEHTLFLSDFYMSQKDLTEILTHHGIDKFIPAGFSSADVFLNKRSGKLFDFIGKKYNVKNDAWIHFGDNEWSDVKIPESKGIKSVHFVPQDEDRIRKEKELYFHDKAALFNKIVNKIINKNTASDKIKLLGIKSAPFMIGFCLFILEKAVENETDKIFFFTREGEFFIKVYEKIISCLKMTFPDVNFPECQLLEVSRLATFCPSLKSVTLDEMMRLWNLYSSQSMGALLKTLNVDEQPLLKIFNKYNLDLTELIEYPWLDERVIKLFSDVEFIKYIEDNISMKRSALISYFAEKGIFDGCKKVTVVDVGWRGTIQDNIALLFPNTNFVGVYLGLQKYLNPQPVNSVKFSYGPDLNIKNEYPHFLDSVAPIEMITNSPTGSVLGYQNRDGSHIAIRKISTEENSAYFSFTKNFQEGIIHAIPDWCEQISLSVLTSTDLRDTALSIWGDLINGQSTELNATYSNLNHNETFGLGGYVNKKHVPSMGAIFASGFSSVKRDELIRFIKSNQWPRGIYERKDISGLHKFILANLIKIAVFYKRKFMKR